MSIHSTETTQPVQTRRMTHMEAVIEAMALEMRRDPRVFFIGHAPRLHRLCRLG